VGKNVSQAPALGTEQLSMRALPDAEEDDRKWLRAKVLWVLLSVF
jgi:hypothetical protein